MTATKVVLNVAFTVVTQCVCDSSVNAVPDGASVSRKAAVACARYSGGTVAICDGFALVALTCCLRLTFYSFACACMFLVSLDVWRDWQTHNPLVH